MSISTHNGKMQPMIFSARYAYLGTLDFGARPSELIEELARKVA